MTELAAAEDPSLQTLNEVWGLSVERSFARCAMTSVRIEGWR
jgi:hypothetical protein